MSAGFFKGFVESGREKFGEDSILVGSQEEESQFGLELPSFALQYIYHSNILPMTKVTGVAGAPASSKSAHAFDMMKLFMDNGGYAHLVETENKFNMHYLHSVVGPQNHDRYRVDKVETVQDAQNRISDAVDYYKTNCPKKDVPFIIVVDSLMGNNSEGVQKEIDKEGHASKAYPEGALVWTQYFRSLCSSLINQPISIFFTNHLKVKLDSGCGENVKTKGGGVAQDFHACQYLYMRKINDIRQVHREGSLIEIKAQKCGLGPCNRVIEVPCLWKFDVDEKTNQPVQTTWWDWHAATAKLLGEKDNGLSPRIKEVSDVTCNSNKYSSKRLGLVQVSDTELGEALHRDAAYMKDLQNVCGFRTWKVFGKDSKKEEPAPKSEKPKKAPKGTGIGLEE
jgi:RecA/RadA recombinase